MALKAIFLHGTVVIDGWLVSPLGETALAAMGLGAAIGGFVAGGIFAFSNAMQIRSAQASGTQDPVFQKSVLASGLTLSFAIGLLGLTIILTFGQGMLVALAPNAQVADLAWDYLSIFTIVIMGEALGQCLASYFNGSGRTRIPLYGYCLSVPINILASVVLIHGLWGFPAYGVAGAAMGSGLAIGVQALFMLYQFLRTDGYLMRVPGWRQATFGKSLQRHFWFSLPIAVTFISANFAMRVCMLIYAQMSLQAFAAMTLMMPWVMVAGTIGMQWAQATGIVVAQLLGQRREEGDLDRFLSSAWRASFVAAAIVAAVYTIICLLPGVLYPSLNAETRAILSSFALVLLVLPFPKQSNAICGNVLRASGDTVYVMHVFIWTQWLFRVPATAVAVLVLGLSPVWVLSLLFWEELIKFPAFHRRLLRGAWKHAVVSE